MVDVFNGGSFCDSSSPNIISSPICYSPISIHTHTLQTNSSCDDSNSSNGIDSRSDSMNECNDRNSFDDTNDTMKREVDNNNDSSSNDCTACVIADVVDSHVVIDNDNNR